MLTWTCIIHLIIVCDVWVLTTDLQTLEQKCKTTTRMYYAAFQRVIKDNQLTGQKTFDSSQIK